MKKKTCLWFVIIGLFLFLVVVGCYFIKPEIIFSHREGIDSQKMSALITIINEPSYKDDAKMTILRSMTIGDPRFAAIISNPADPTAEQASSQVQQLKSLAQQLLKEPVAPSAPVAPSVPVAPVAPSAALKK